MLRGREAGGGGGGVSPFSVSDYSKLGVADLLR